MASLILFLGLGGGNDTPQCHFQFPEFEVCAEIHWPDPPLTFVANSLEVHFYDSTSMQPVRFLPKLTVTVWNHYESRWGLEPDISQPKDFTHVRYINNLFFDVPGYWKVFLNLTQENVTSSVHMKVHLEDL